MKKFYVLIILGWLGIIDSYSQETKKVLFIGNSYTASNNLPLLIDQMANSTGDDLIYDSNTPGGYTLKQHTSNATTLSKINQGDWDFVVLQDQSQYPSLSDNFVETNVYPYAEALNDAILASNSCTETIFYATWGRKNGDAQNCANWPPVCTYEGMDDLLQERYRFMADQNEALLSPVSWVWRYIRENYPNIELYTSDNSHPSLAGSYAAAATFYTLLFGKNPIQIPFESSLSPEVAVQLKNAVKEVVFNNMEFWNVGKYNPAADFTYNATENSGEYQFQNQSNYATEFLWDFGDGATSTEENPIHQFATNGTYTIRLSASNCGIEDSHEIQLEAVLNVSNLEEQMHKVYPNPARNILHIKNLQPKEYWNLFDQEGKLILKNQTNSVAELKHLPSGIYTLVILNEHHQFIHQIRIQKSPPLSTRIN